MTTLHHPFIITSALAPGLKIGKDATLSLLSIDPSTEHRDKARFELHTPDFTYVDEELRSGVGGFRSKVEAFESFIGFLEAAGESRLYHERTGHPGECEDLFPPHVVGWAAEHADDLALARCEITDADSGAPLNHLIEN